jgi:hypothetical protein
VFCGLIARREIYRRMLATTIDFKFEVQPVAFVQTDHAGAFDGRNVDECVGLSVIALNKAEALHRIEELDRTARLFARQRPLLATTAFARALVTIARWAAVRNRKRFAVDLEIGRRDLAAAVDEREAERLPFGQAGQARLLNGGNVDENVFTAIVTNDKAEALLSVEKLNDAGSLTNDLGWHSAARTAATESAAAAAAAKTAAAATTAKTIATAAATESVAATTEAITTAGKSAAVTTAAFIAEIVALVATATAAIAAATLIETHAVPVLSSIRPRAVQENHAPDEGKAFPQRNIKVRQRFAIEQSYPQGELNC